METKCNFWGLLVGRYKNIKNRNNLTLYLCGFVFYLGMREGVFFFKYIYYMFCYSLNGENFMGSFSFSKRLISLFLGDLGVLNMAGGVGR